MLNTSRSLPVRWLLAALVALAPLHAGAADKLSRPGTLLGAHPTTPAKSARLALLKQHASIVPLNHPKPGKIANSLNRRPGKTIMSNRTLPK